MTIKTTRELIVQRLNVIRAIPKQQYSAMELHQNGLSRIQRKEDTQFFQKIRLQEKRLLKDLQVIDNYLQLTSVKVPETYDEFGDLIQVPLIPEPSTSLWGTIPLPKKILIRTSSRPRTKRRII